MSRPPHDIRISAKRKSPWRHLWRLFWLDVFVLMGAPFVMLTVVSDDPALVEETAPPSGAVAAKAKRLAGALRRDIGAARQRSSVTITERDANSMMALVRRGLEAFSGRVKIGVLLLKASATVHVQQNPFGEFINLQLSVDPSDSGLSLGEMRAGAVSVPGRLMTEAMRRGLNIAAENDLGDQLFEAIYAVHLRPGEVQVDCGPVRNLLAQTSVLKPRGKALRDELKLLGDVEVTRGYFVHLCAEASATPGATLGRYLSWAFTRAASRTRAGNNAVA